MCEQAFFDEILGAARGKFSGSGLLVIGQRFAQPSHRPVKMVQLKSTDSLDLLVFFPFFSRPITAGSEQSVQHGQKQSPFDGKFELPPLQ